MLLPVLSMLLYNAYLYVMVPLCTLWHFCMIHTWRTLYHNDIITRINILRRVSYFALMHSVKLQHCVTLKLLCDHMIGMNLSEPHTDQYLVQPWLDHHAPEC